jgi:hypothetical protein
MVVVVALARNVALFISKDLFFHLIHHCRNRRIHVRRYFLAVIEIAARLDIQLGDMALMFFNCKNEMHFKNFIHDPA